MSTFMANFFFEAINFLLLAALLGWLLFKPVRRVLDEDRKRYLDGKKEQELLKDQAESLLREAQSVREAADREALQRRDGVLAAARQKAERILEDNRQKQAQERNALEQELKTLREAQAENLAETVGQIAASSLERFLTAVAGPSLEQALIRIACRELQSLPVAALQKATVESASPLDDENRRLLVGVLGTGFSARVVASLGAGVRVTTAAGQVDATARALTRQAAKRVVEAAAEGDKHD